MTSLKSIGGKKGSIFVLGASRESAIRKLKDATFTTAELLDEVAEGEIKELKKILAEKLQRDEFGLRNAALTEDKLALFVENTRVFEWFAAGHSKVAGRIEAGLRERLAPPMSDAERIRELEEQNRHLLDLLKNQQNQPHPIPINYPSIDRQLPPRKRLRIAEPEPEDDFFASSDEESVEKEGGPSRPRSSD
ncbi:hypothetical protein HK104_003978 [Borealophlyctis nickersoniae]|nr:hypothetical protein HK104_003978 [Borealophlyctis nickersoniae]